MRHQTVALGQHFLSSSHALTKIVAAGELSPHDLVVEVGPGKGALTEQLLPCAGKIIAIEKDVALVAFLKEKYAKQILENHLKIIQHDILDFDLGSLTQPYKVIANIPYYITGALIEKFLSAEHQPERMVLLVQKEVAERVVARNGKESILSMSVKIFGDPSIALRVPRGAFNPPPTVDSAVLVIKNISRERLDERGVDAQHFFKVLKRGFAHPRKLLRANLELPASALAHCNINERARAENLTLTQWLCLATNT